MNKGAANQAATKSFLAFPLGLYIMLKPFYFWMSGMPQISDILLVLTFFLYILTGKQAVRLDARYGKLLFANWLFVNYVFIVNIGWTMALDGGLPALRISSYYLFNFIAFLFVLLLNSDPGHSINGLVFKVVLFSVVLQTLFYLAAGGFTGGRVTAFFNNPNQLGYHSLVCAALLLFTGEKAAMKNSSAFIGLFCTGLLVMASLSKAAIIAYVFMMVYYFIFYKKRRKIGTGWIILFTFLLFLLIAVLLLDSSLLKSNNLLNAVYDRISIIGSDSDDTLAGRGYTRLFDFRSQLFFGIGEGAYFRFEPPGEFHSTLGNLLLSYGIVGLLFFIAIALIIMKINRFRDAYLIMSILLYGATHNGIRNTLFWILLGLVFSTGVMEKNQKENGNRTVDETARIAGGG